MELVYCLLFILRVIRFFIVRIIRTIFHSSLTLYNISYQQHRYEIYEGWNFNSGNYLFTTDTK